MSAEHKLVHYSRKKLDELRPLTYEELTQDRTSGRWADKPDLAAKYVEDRRRFEKALHKRLAAKGITTKPDTSFLYATLSGHERFGGPDQYKHEAELTPELINSSFFDVVGTGKSRTTFGQKGLLAALKKWKEAEKANALKEEEYMGMAIKPRIEVITPNSLKPVSVYGGAIKEAGSKWRSAENLLKLIKTMEKSKGYSMGLQTDKYNRHKVLQLVSDALGLNKNIGQDYKAFADKLNWRSLPEKVQQRMLGTEFEHASPKYLFRGITPGNNIRNPFEFDNKGLKADFLHGSPSFSSASHYAKPFGVSSGNNTYQVFRPTKNQAYMPDFTAVNFVDKATGKLTGPASSLTWAKQKPFLQEYAENINKQQPGKFDAPSRAHSAFRELVYETPVFPDNKMLGTFLARLKPATSDTRSGLSILDQRRDLLSRAEIARIPNSLKNKAIQMGLEAQKRLNV